ncbi:MAG TPA: hypothetical protein P5218_02505, partial [Planctomycetota bacterium]|nr:hypothetical protein [Planctomycetota bacterium]
AGEPDEWLDPMIAPSRAPEFLDRIVEQRLSAIEAQLQTARARRQRTRSVRVGSLTLTGILAGALALALIPWGHWRASAAPSPIHIVQYSSLNGLTSAHPDQAQFATLVGDFGAFVESPSTDGGVR